MQRINVLKEKFNINGRCCALCERVLDNGKLNGWVVAVGFIKQETEHICQGEWDHGYYFTRNKHEAEAFYLEYTMANDFILDKKPQIEEFKGKSR